MNLVPKVGDPITLVDKDGNTICTAELTSFNQSTSMYQDGAIMVSLSIRIEKE